jgi:hypothetical protein
MRGSESSFDQYDIYISTGGQNPLIGDGAWDTKYYAFIDALKNGT